LISDKLDAKRSGSPVSGAILGRKFEWQFKRCDEWILNGGKRPAASEHQELVANP
jgi:hypothetical protein